MPKPTFREAADALCLSVRDLSELLGIPVQSVKQARMDPGKSGYRAPPAGWEAKLLEVARQRGREVGGLVKALEAGAKGKASR